ncbi:alpha/beta hydrolase [Streptomyces sp. ActVer]|nr:alpha/beta hydrolase [Streptomyces sp. ActVer]MCZ4514639.1 alpha/beta hydrolase [Streptomyces sp. ActVer]
MPLLPGVQRLIVMAEDGPSLADIPIQQARLKRDTLAASFGTGDRVGSTSDVDIPTPSGTVPARVYHPEGGGADLPPLLYAHGGGWSVGVLNTSDALCRKLTASSGGVVVKSTTADTREPVPHRRRGRARRISGLAHPERSRPQCRRTRNPRGW